MGGDIWIASAHARFKSKTDVFFFLNFPTTNARDANFKVSLSGDINGSACVSVLGFNVLCASAGACYRVTGGYNNTIGWNIDGKAAVKLEVDILNHPNECNSAKYKYIVVPVGARVCGYADVHINYEQKGSNKGLDLGGSLGKNDGLSEMNCN